MAKETKVNVTTPVKVTVGAGPKVEDEPKPKYAADDYSIDARMWRLEQDHIRMGARPK